MRNVICFTLFFVFGKVLSQEVVIENDSLLLWQADRSLKWEDFKGPPKPRRIHNKAASGIAAPYKYKQHENQVPDIYVLTYFDKTISWNLINDVETLEHEQLHFDIRELYVRKVRKKIKKLKEQEVVDIELYIKAIDSLWDKGVEYQELFDNQVLANYPKQKEWRKRIDKELEELKEYEYVPEQ